MTARQWTMPDIARELGVPTATVRSWLHRGQMPEPTGRVQRSPWWSADDIEAWMEQRKVGDDGLTARDSRR